jgi:hypothetical protein
VFAARDRGEHYRDVAERWGLSPKYVLNVWAGRRRSRDTGMPDNQEPRPRRDRARHSEGRKGVGLTDEELGDLYHETDDFRVRWLVLHAIKLRHVIREHIEE